jgi:hypothetical protein
MNEQKIITHYDPNGTMHGVQVAVRLSVEEIAKLDAWIAEQREKLGIELSRAAAIRARLNTLKW